MAEGFEYTHHYWRRSDGYIAPSSSLEMLDDLEAEGFFPLYAQVDGGDIISVAATQAILDALDADYLQDDRNDGYFHALADVRERIGGGPAPQSDHGLTVSDIAAHLRSEIAARPFADGHAALVDTLTWLESQ